MSNWTLTADSRVDGFEDGDRSFANVESCGFDVYYNSSSENNGYLNGATLVLNGGAKLRPM